MIPINVSSIFHEIGFLKKGISKRAPYDRQKNQVIDATLAPMI